MLVKTNMMVISAHEQAVGREGGRGRREEGKGLGEGEWGKEACPSLLSQKPQTASGTSNLELILIEQFITLYTVLFKVLNVQQININNLFQKNIFVT